MAIFPHSSGYDIYFPSQNIKIKTFKCTLGSNLEINGTCYQRNLSKSQQKEIQKSTNQKIFKKICAVQHIKYLL